MKTSTTHYRLPARTGRAMFLSISLLTFATIGISSQSLAQSNSIGNSIESLPESSPTAQALTRSNRSVERNLSRRVLVRSKSLLVRAAVVEDKLLKRAEFTQLGFVITRDEADADLVLELRHDLLTKYVFSVVDVKTQTLLASGKVSSLGGTVGGKVAKRFVNEMARIPAP